MSTKIKTFPEFLEKFKTHLVKDLNWSISKAYHFNRDHDRLYAAFEKGLTIEEASDELFTGVEG